MFIDHTVLITGGTGAFGNAVLNRFLNAEIAEIRVFGRDEKKQHDMRLEFNNPRLKFYMGDVRRCESLMDAMTGVGYVFHAAALKQGPSCEFHPMEASLTNAVGTEYVINAAEAAGVDRVVVLSTTTISNPDYEFERILDGQPRGEDRQLRIVHDYDMPDVSEKVVRVIASYTSYVNRVVWHRDEPARV